MREVKKTMKKYKNNTKMFGICLLILGIVAIFSFGINATSAANSSSVYVSTQGNNSWDGLNSAYTSGINGPKATITNATGTVASNGTVQIASGTYNESNITINTDMTIIGENQKNTIINGQQYGNSIFTIASGVNITIINLTLTNGTTSNGIGGGAIDNENGGTLTISNSTFTNNTATSGGAIYNENGGIVTVKFSRIVGNNKTDVYNSSGRINAEDNWWGTNFVGTNPKDAGRVNFTVTKWIVLTITAKPQTINDGDKSTVTADLLHDNLGNYLNPINGHVPDGITVNFSSDAYGSVNPETNNTTNGSTFTTFTGHSSGVSEVSATVDQQTVTTNITNQLTPTNSTTVKATTTTTKIPMQHTGIPIAGLILGILSVLGGSIMSHKK
jgi:hypothetical protein